MVAKPASPADSERSGHVAAADGTPIAWTRHGVPGTPAIVLTNGFATSSFYWDHIVEFFAPRAQLVTWDLKGHGASGPARDRTRVGVADSVDDMVRVMDRLGLETATLAGFSMGCQVVLEAWRHVPERIDAMIPVLGTYGRPFDSLLHPAFGRLTQLVFETIGPAVAGSGLRAVSRLSATNLGHRLNQRSGMIGRQVTRERMQPFAAHLATIDPLTWVAMGVAAQNHSAEDLLHTIEVPVLVVSGGRDVMTPEACSRRMVDAIPNVEHLHLPRATHAGLYEHPVAINRVVDAFLVRNGILAGAPE